MIKLALAVLATIAIVAFVISNAHHVDLCFPACKPMAIRLIFLLLSAFVVGMLVPVFYGLIRRLDSERQLRRENELRQAVERVNGDIVE